MRQVCVEVYMHRLYVFWKTLQFSIRRRKKRPLLEGQTGRTHKRKPRGTRKRKNMGWRQYKKHVWKMYGIGILEVY